MRFKLGNIMRRYYKCWNFFLKMVLWERSGVFIKKVTKEEGQKYLF